MTLNLVYLYDVDTEKAMTCFLEFVLPFNKTTRETNKLKLYLMYM